MYEVTATRRRPQVFKDLAGQEFVAETLSNSIKTKQIAHAYLFTGPRGCGKTSTARILAKALNCQAFNEPTDTPCGNCPSCKAIANSSSLDVIEIDGASNNSVSNVRQIIDELMYPPNNSRYKIYIIDEVHMLTGSAFNALLKTIEEPPPHVVFIFATTELQKVPATIKSRCQQYNFRLVSVERVKELLRDACNEMNIKADDEALYWIAKEGGGSVRDTYTLFDQVAAFSNGEISYDKIRDKLGLLGVDRLNVLFEFCATGKTVEAMNKLDEFLLSGISIDQIISNSSEYLRSLLLIKNGVTKESLLGQDAKRYSSVVLSTWNTVQTERALSIFLQLYRDIRYTLSPRYELELAFSRLCWLYQYVSPVEVKAAVDQARNLLLQGNGGNIPLGNNGTTSINGLSASSSPAASSLPSFSNPPSANGSIPDNGSLSANSSLSANGSALSGGNSSPSKNESASENLSAGIGFSNSAEQAQTNKENAAPAFRSSPNSAPSMPFFSALGAGQESKPQGEGVSQNPFLNGGALPPEKSEAEHKPENVQNDISQNSSKTNVALESANFSGNENSYSNQAPDDDGYADAGAPDDALPPEDNVPPEDDWGNPSEEEMHQQAAEEFDDSAENDENGSVDKNMKEHESDETPFTSPDGRQLTLGKIYGQTIAGLIAENSALIASALTITGKWNLQGNKITTTISEQFQHGVLTQNISTLNAQLSKICGMPMTFEITYREIKKEVQEIELPIQVKILCNTFKGTIVGGKK